MKLNVFLLSNQIRGIDGAGGLGDVPVGLAKELLTRGDIDIRLAMPGYADINGEKNLADRFDKPPVAQFTVPFGNDMRQVSVFEVKLPRSKPSVTCYLFRCEEQFDALDPNTGAINKNTPDKAILFARSALEFLRRYADFRVDLIHCNDWHTGMVPVYLNTLYRDDMYLGRVATLYTSHNAGGEAFQGGFGYPDYINDSLLSLAGLQDSDVFIPGETRSLCHNFRINFSKGGFGYADLFNTVSRQYRKELLTPAFAGGLQGLFKERQSDFSSIVNGIDVAEWNPAKDENLGACKYSAKLKIETVHKRKRGVRDLLRKWKIPQKDELPSGDKSSGDKPNGDMPYQALNDESILVGVVTRIDNQKVPILMQAIERICATDNVQIAFLGSAERNDPIGRRYEEELREMSESSDGKLLFFDGFDIPLSHMIYAASEIFLVPSVYEPCGLTQIIAMRYGAVPVVRSVGGLVDTVIDEQDVARKDGATGFRYSGTVTEDSLMSDWMKDAQGLVGCFERAVAIHEDQQRWDELVENGMCADWSWAVPSMQYVRLYQETVRRAAQRTLFSLSEKNLNAK